MLVAKDFYNEIADRLGWPQVDSIESPSPSTRHRKLFRLGNRVVKSMGSFNDWPMLRKSETLIFVASETSTTVAGSEQYVTLTQNSDIVTVANKTFTDTYVGRAIQFSGSNYVYRIIAVPTTAGQLQLNAIWVEASKIVADKVTFTIAMDQYAVPDDFDRFSDKAQNAFQPITITPVEPRVFAARRRQEPGITLDDPVICTVSGVNEGESNQLAHFQPYPKNQRMVVYDYQRIHPDITSNQDKILYPASAIEIVIDAILEIANGDFEADDTKVARVLERAMRGYNMQQSHLGPTANTIELRPANDIRVQFKKFGTAVKIDWGEYWDRAEDILP